jgi:hypothetical protein
MGLLLPRLEQTVAKIFCGARVHCWPTTSISGAAVDRNQGPADMPSALLLRRP